MTLARFTALPRRSRNVLCRMFDTHAAQLRSTAPGWRVGLSASAAALRTIAMARGDILRFLRTGDEELAYRLRRRFGLAAGPAPAHAVPNDLFRPDLVSRSTPPATIIIPIYNAAPESARLLTRLPATIPSDQPVIIIDDHSDDPRMQRILRDFSQGHPTARVRRLPRNGGFVAAVTAGIQMVEPGHHVVILNSDTLPPLDWLPRLLAPISMDDAVASVTPFSTAAEILSIPRPGIPSELSEQLVTQLDGVAARLSARQIDLPTGIGFCIALNRRFLDQIGGLDPAFGRGYGEEVDWCLRAAAAGGRNVVATNLVVGHEGNASFGTAERASRVAHAGRRIASRFPSYPQDALDWENRDPVGPERLAISLAWAAATARAPIRIFIAHGLGGGAEFALQDEIAVRLVNSDDPVVILRVGGPALWRVELLGQRFSISGDANDATLLHELLRPLTARHVVYSCGVHASDPIALPGTILRLADSQRLELRLHDYFIVSPSWNLLDNNGRYRGVPDIGTTDPAHTPLATGTNGGWSHRDWRDRWAAVVSAAAEITVFDRSGKRLIECAYAEARGKTVLRPHQLKTVPPRLAAGGQTIGVLGGINRAKGAAVIEALSQQTRRRIAIIGELDGEFRLAPPHIVHGRYDRPEIAELARRYDIGLWLIPSVWPETFSFATREALATGLPVTCFDLGAQAEAVSQASNGLVLRCSPENTSDINAALEHLFNRAATATLLQ